MLGVMNLPAATPPDDGPGGRPTDAAAESDAARRRRLDEIFGDVLPDVTGDERGAGRSVDDRWYLENRPPHHG